MTELDVLAELIENLRGTTQGLRVENRDLRRRLRLATGLVGQPAMPSETSTPAMASPVASAVPAHRSLADYYAVPSLGPRGPRTATSRGDSTEPGWPDLVPSEES